jgi:hypothetical protein
MALSLVFEGPSTYALVDNGVDVGCLTQNLLVFTGFPTMHDAEHAADAGYVALLHWLAYRRGGVREDAPALNVALSEDGTSEWIGPEGDSLVRVIRSPDSRRFALEFLLPKGLYTAMAAHAATHVHEAIVEAQRERARTLPELPPDERVTTRV